MIGLVWGEGAVLDSKVVALSNANKSRVRCSRLPLACYEVGKPLEGNVGANNLYATLIVGVCAGCAVCDSCKFTAENSYGLVVGTDGLDL